MKKRNLINGMKPEFGNIEQIKILQVEQRQKDDAKELKDFYKNLSPDERAFQAFVNVDIGMGLIKMHIEDLTKFLNGRSPVIMMIDKSTGYENAIIKSFLLKLKEGYNFIIPELKKMGDIERHNQYKELLIKVKDRLKNDYKGIKAIDLPKKA